MLQVKECYESESTKIAAITRNAHALLLERKVISADTRLVMLEDLEEAFILMDPNTIEGSLLLVIKNSYGSIALNVRMEVAREALMRVQQELTESHKESTPGGEEQQLLAAFTQLESDKGLFEHLEGCWGAYNSARRSFTAPYTSILQSSGSGKSRTLHKLAENMCKTDGEKMRARVLYMCVREQRSIGFPRSTLHLGAWLYGLDEGEIGMSEKLVAMYEYAQQNWESVGEEWLQVCTSHEANEAVATALQAAAKKALLNVANNLDKSSHLVPPAASLKW